MDKELREIDYRVHPSSIEQNYKSKAETICNDCNSAQLKEVCPILKASQRRAKYPENLSNRNGEDMKNTLKGSIANE
ncbi:MAG: hypothetical protein ABSF44_10895 [Candidatus Bathyarchaeia archaeon]|jgi:hypothetical protein